MYYKYFYSDVYVPQTLRLNQIYAGIPSRFKSAIASGSNYISQADKTGSCTTEIVTGPHGREPRKKDL
jgi:hypothetical protein